MALPTWVGLGTLTGGTGTVTPPLPAGVTTDDLLLLFVESFDQAVTAPSGWTLVPAGAVGNPGGSDPSTATRMTVFWRRYAAGVAAPTVPDPGDHAIAVVGAVRGVIATGVPFNGTVSTQAHTDFSFPGVTTSENDCLVVQAVGWQLESTASQITSPSNGSLANLTKRHDAGLTAGNGGGIGILTGEKATAGAVFATSATGIDPNRNQNKSYTTVAVLPQATGTTHDLAVTFAGVSAMTADLVRVHELATTFVGVGTLEAAMGPTVYDLAVVFAGSSALTANLTFGDVLLLASVMEGTGSLSADLTVLVPGGSGEVVAPFFTPGTIVDAVRLSSANEWPWAHEVVNFGSGRVTAVRPRQVPVASVVADAAGSAAFDLPVGDYWLVGERDGAVRRVRRRVSIGR